MRDYAKFLSDNPRYSGVFEAKNDLQGQIDVIAKSGYATSSNYPNLLNSVSRMVTRAMPQDGTVAMGYAPTPAARGQNPALSGIQGALLPPLGPPGSGAPLMRPAAKKPNFLQMAMQGIRGGVGGFAQQAQPTVMRAAQRAAPTIMQAALGTVAGRTALIEPGLKNIMTGSPAGSRNTQVVQSYRDQGNSPSQSYAAANSAAVERAIAGAANPEQARRLNSR